MGTKTWRPVLPLVLTNDGRPRSSRTPLSHNAAWHVCSKPAAWSSGCAPDGSRPEYRYGSRSKTMKSGKFSTEASKAWTDPAKVCGRPCASGSLLTREYQVCSSILAICPSQISVARLLQNRYVPSVPVCSEIKRSQNTNGGGSNSTCFWKKCFPDKPVGYRSNVSGRSFTYRNTGSARHT